MEKFAEILGETPEYTSVKDRTLLSIAHGTFGDFNQTASAMTNHIIHGNCILCKFSLNYALCRLCLLNKEDVFDSLEIADYEEAVDIAKRNRKI